MKNISFKLEHKLPKQLIDLYPAYSASPMLSTRLGDRSFWMKDETNRMGLGSFKPLGGIYAVARLIIGPSLELSDITRDNIREKASELTFVCASAGNHGIAVASGARLFGARARIHLAESVPMDFTNRLVNLGAQVIQSGANYEESIMAAIEDSNEANHIHLADGSWDGYTEPARLVMEGYTVISEEMRMAFEAESQWPSHVFLQAGVGGLAASLTYMIRKNWSVQHKIIIVEQDRAPCIKKSVDIGGITIVEGEASTMGRLDCKKASILAFDILRSEADHFITITDEMALNAVVELTECGVMTTPSGAAGYAAMKTFELPDGATPLVIISEGQVL